jgi:hypothetical protein
MPLADYRCPACGAIRTAAFPFGTRAPDLDVRCPAHQWPLGGTRMDWIPAARFSLFSDSGALGPRSTAKFTLPVEDPRSPTGFRDETIGSLADIRRLERESEQAERNGEGRRMIWRSYSQDRGNAHVHTFGTDPSLVPSKRLSNGLPVGVQRGDPVTAVHGEIV